MHFHIASLKLTAFYVLIAMAISVSFSFVLYNIASKELERGFGRQTKILRDIPARENFFSNIKTTDLEKMRIDQINESLDHLRINLILFNLLILFLSSGASYFLARKSLEPIEQAFDAQNRFTADASHELRTPITAMRTEIEVALRDKKLNLSEAKKLLQSNLEEAEKLESLSNALLKLARHQEDIQRDFKEVPLQEVLIEAYDKVASLAEEKNIEFENDLKDISALADKQSLIELFVILLDNAIKYSPSGSKINIVTEKHKNIVLVRIKDRGLGIKASDLHHIFDRFYRADASRTKEKVNGYGLGLSIAKSIVDLHGGTISATSHPGKGSEFVVKL